VSAVPKTRLQLQKLRRCCFRFFDAPEFGKRSGQRHVCNTETWTGLHSFPSGSNRILIATAMKVPQRKCHMS